jgi:hypothetical protein
MTWFHAARARLRLLAPHAAESRIVHEIHFHIEWRRSGSCAKRSSITLRSSRCRMARLRHPGLAGLVDGKVGQDLDADERGVHRAGVPAAAPRASRPARDRRPAISSTSPAISQDTNRFSSRQSALCEPPFLLAASPASAPRSSRFLKKSAFERRSARRPASISVLLNRPAHTT